MIRMMSRLRYLFFDISLILYYADAEQRLNATNHERVDIILHLTHQISQIISNSWSYGSAYQGAYFRVTFVTKNNKALFFVTKCVSISYRWQFYRSLWDQMRLQTSFAGNNWISQIERLLRCRLFNLVQKKLRSTDKSSYFLFHFCSYIFFFYAMYFLYMFCTIFHNFLFCFTFNYIIAVKSSLTTAYTFHYIIRDSRAYKWEGSSIHK